MGDTHIGVAVAEISKGWVLDSSLGLSENNTRKTTTGQACARKISQSASHNLHLKVAFQKACSGLTDGPRSEAIKQGVIPVRVLCKIMARWTLGLRIRGRTSRPSLISCFVRHSKEISEIETRSMDHRDCRDRRQVQSNDLKPRRKRKLNVYVVAPLAWSTKNRISAC